MHLMWCTYQNHCCSSKEKYMQEKTICTAHELLYSSSVVPVGPHSFLLF